MQLKSLQAIGLTSALLLSTLGAVVVSPQAQANSFARSTRLVANQQSTAKVVAEGQFVTVEQDHPTEGQAQIIEEDGQRYLKFDDNFTTARGPAVEVLLHRNNSVAVNLEEGDYITLAKLQSFDGAQKYLIPDDLDLNEYQSVVIWCQQFNVTFGYAAF